MQQKLFELIRFRIVRVILIFLLRTMAFLTPFSVVYNSTHVIAFLHPLQSSTVIIIPKRKIKRISDISDKDMDYLLSVFASIEEITRQLGTNQSCVLNMVSQGENNIFDQLHFELLTQPIAS